MLVLDRKKGVPMDEVPVKVCANNRIPLYVQPI